MSDLKKEIKQEIMKDMEHLVGIITEAFDHKVGLIVEGMQSMRDELRREIRDGLREVNSRIDLTQIELREIASQGRENRAAIGRLELRFDEMDARITRNERHITALQSASS